MSTNIGLQFKVKPRPEYNNFPAIKQIESRIAKLPYEEGWLFDSTGMPVQRNRGTGNNVSMGYADVELAALPKFHQSFYQNFWAPVTSFTHNHPTHFNPSYQVVETTQRYSPLSRLDLENAAVEGLTIRAVNDEYQGGMVHEFTPGLVNGRGRIAVLLDEDPKLRLNPKELEQKLLNKTYLDYDEYDREIEIPVTEFNKPSLDSYSLEYVQPVSSIADSFRIGNQQLQTNNQYNTASFSPNSDGSYQSFVNNKPYKLLTQQQADEAVEKLKPTNWNINWNY